MAKRNSPEQTEHDLVVKVSAASYTKHGGTAIMNLGSEKNKDVSGYYPDVVAQKQDGTKVIEEIETDTSVTQDECDTQWKLYSKLGYLFVLIVPQEKVGLARRFARKSGVSLTLQGYVIEGNNVYFYDEHGKKVV